MESYCQFRRRGQHYLRHSYLQAFTIFFAARSTSILSIGRESLTANHAYSNLCCPLNSALRGLPVRINPGQTVVTKIPSFLSSARSPSLNPTNANLLALYGTRCGTLIFPPIEEIFT